MVSIPDMLKDLLSRYICVYDRLNVCVLVCVIDRVLVQVWVRNEAEPVTIFESEPVRKEIDNGFFLQRMRREDRILENLRYTPT